MRPASATPRKAGWNSSTSIGNSRKKTLPEKQQPKTSGGSRPTTATKRPPTPKTPNVSQHQQSPIVAPKPQSNYGIPPRVPVLQDSMRPQSRQQRRAMSTYAPAVAQSQSQGSHYYNQKQTMAPNMGPKRVKERFEAILRSKNISDAELKDAQRQLRMTILLYGLPKGEERQLRGSMWKALMGIHKVSASEYTMLVEKGPTDVHDKIKDDTFRTLATNKTFLTRVTEDMLSRLLNAFVWKMKSNLLSMNVIAAPFLYTMSELDAFYSFLAFIKTSCPLYVQPALEGVHCGVKLLDMCLRVLDPSLYNYLASKNLTATVYAFPSVLTFSACVQPLEEVLHLWDFLLAFGVHLNIICIIAQLVLIKDQIMKSPRTLPDLDARAVISKTIELIPRLPEDLYDLLVRHPFDPTVHDAVVSEDI